MTVLSVCQSVATKQGFTRPVAVFGETTDEAYLLQDLVSQSLDYVREDANWQALSKIATITGDGTTVAFDVPSDYDYIPRDGKLWTTSLSAPLSQIASLDDWLSVEVRNYDYVYNAWIIYGNQVHFRPPLDSGITAQYFYQTNQAVVATDSTTFKAEVTADTDNFRVPERLIMLCMNWMYRRDRELPFDSEMMDYERAKEKAVTRDGGPEIITIGKRHYPRDVSIAYPQAISVT